MRSPKYGDKCEHAEYDSKLGKNVRTCPVRHMAGKPPGQLVARVQNQWTILVCTAHSMHMEAPNVRKQRKLKVVAEQIDLVEVAESKHTPDLDLDAFYDRHYGAMEMPEGEP